MIKNNFSVCSFLLFFLSCILPAAAMEKKPAKRTIPTNLLFRISKPQKNHWELQGHNDDNKSIGIVKYNCDQNANWRITKFEVESEFRNSGHGYGTALLRKCFQEMTKSTCVKITWLAYPQDNTMTLEQLKAIYHRIVDKIKQEIPGTFITNDTMLGTNMLFIPAQQ